MMVRLVKEADGYKLLLSCHRISERDAGRSQWRQEGSRS